MPGTGHVPEGEVLLAWLAVAVGLVGIVSSLTPEFSDRSDLVRGVLPPGIPAAARIAALAFGLSLIWLSRSLVRRRRRAWQLAVLFVLAISLAHLAKGLDFEESIFGALLLAALLRYRRRFDVPSDPIPLRPLLGAAVLVAAAAGASLALELREIERLADTLFAVALALAGYALHLWLRPLSDRVRQPIAERRRAEELVRSNGMDSLAFFALRRDKNWFFSSTRRSFLAYRVLGGVALVSGDPIGEEREFPELLAEFRRVCHASGWRLALLGVRAELLPLARELGLRPIKFGDEAIVRPERFSLEGRGIRKVRQSVSRARRAGYSVRVLPASGLDGALRTQIDEVSEEWRGGSAERGFSMAMDELFGQPETVFAIAQSGALVGGFLHLVPTAGGRGFSLSSMRRREGTPNGLMEFLVAETVLWSHERSIDEISLNFCVFADLVSGEQKTPLRTAAQVCLRGLDRLFQLERLLVFTRKFATEWRPRYVCVESLTDVPRVGLAYLRVESLV